MLGDPLWERIVMKHFALVMTLTTLAVLSGCGKKNKSGKPGSNIFPNTYGAPVNLPYNTGTANLGSISTVVQCLTGYQQRIGVQQTSSTGSLPVNAAYVGVTLEGDVAVLTADGSGRPVFTAYVCMRPGIQSAAQAQAAQGVIPNRTNSGCPFDELVATMRVDNYILAFFPIHLSQWKTSVGCRY